MYGKIINRELIYAPMNYKTSSGDLITNFNTNEDLMIQYGFKKINSIEPDYDKERECIVAKYFEEFEDDFVDDGKTYRANNGMFSTESIIVYAILGGLAYYLFIGKRKRD